MVAATSIISWSTFLMSTPCDGKPIVEPPPPPDNFACPPNNIVSSVEELDHYCAYGEWFASSKSDETKIGEYVCNDWKGNKLCEGTIDVNIDVPACHQPTISNCSDSNKDDYFSVCTIEDHAIVKGKTNCNIDQGTFACWDKIENRWCQGRIEKLSDNSEDLPQSIVARESSTSTAASATPTIGDHLDGSVARSTPKLESSSITTFGFVVLGAMFVGVAIGFLTSRQRKTNGRERTVVEYVELDSAENTV